MIRFFRAFDRRAFCWGGVALSLSCSACATAPQTARFKVLNDRPIQAVYEETIPAKQARKARESDIQQLNFAVPSAGITRIRRDEAIQQVSFVETTDSNDGILPVSSHMQPGPWQATDPCEIRQCPAEPRWPAAGPDPLAPGMMACDTCNMPSPELYTDEYLCDGGDRKLPVHYDSFSRMGLDSEDTVLEYTDRTGTEHMQPSNKVCIYAPRFASVRTVSRPHEEQSASEVARVGQLASTGGVHSRLRASNNVKREMTGRIAVRSKASGLDTDAFAGTMANLRRPSAHDKLLNIYQALTFIRSGVVDDADTARLNYGLQAAFAWTREQNPVITAKSDMPLEGHFEQNTAVITGIDEREFAEKLRIVKLADKKTAVPGDEIQFTIRYDNVGGREVHHIRIVDNLTPRLEYIDDSATSDRDGQLVLQDNGEGSQVLVWEMNDPLPGKHGGIITFKARVR